MVSTSAFLDTLRHLHLLEPVQLDELTHALPGRDGDPRLLAKELLGRGWLTAYQANRLLQGRGGELLLGSYVLLEKLGEGGMGAVFKARNWKLGRVVAVKLIRPERLANPDTVRRFQREIRAAAQLDHPHIVRALDADEVAGAHLLVMEYVEGTDLARLVKQHGPLSVALACDYVRQAALGLQHAHERGLVHRDVKPSNLLLQTPRPGRTGAGPVVKVLDLGLARLGSGGDGDASSTLTESGAVMGTPDYLAPEQGRQSHEVDIRADLYSLGCTLYFLLAGRVPFPGGGVSEKLIAHQLDEPVPVEQVRPEVAPGLAGVVRKLMAKRPEDRFQTPAELARVLAEGLASGRWPACRPAPAVPVAVSVATPAALADTAANWSALQESAPTLPPPGQRQRPQGRWRWVLPAALGGGLLLVVLAVVVLLSGGWRPAEPPPVKADPDVVTVEAAAPRPGVLGASEGVGDGHGERIPWSSV
jgi:serine/threonine protein kinase